LSDSDLEDDEDTEAPSLKQKTGSKALPFDSSAISDELERIDYGKYEESVNEGKVVKIPDMAFVT